MRSLPGVKWLASQLLAGGLALTWATGAGAAAGGGHCEYVLELEGAVRTASGSGETLTLIAESVDGRWEPAVWGHARAHDDRANHYGRIVESGASGGRTQLRVRMIVNRGRNKREPGGDYTADLSVAFAAKDGRVEGTWKGAFSGVQGAGALGGSTHSTAGVANFAPPAPGEHPRFLFRRSDIPALKAKARTPFGQKMLERLEVADPLSLTRMAVGHGLLHVLTGENRHAERARELLQADYASGKWVRTEVHYGGIPTYVPVHEGGGAAVEAAIAFDLIHDACDDGFRRAMFELFAHRARYLYHSPANGADSSNWSAIYRSGAGMAALSVLDVPCEALAKPVPPRMKDLRPPADLRSGDAGADVPVVEFQGGEVKSWLTAGPVWRTIGPDLLAPLGRPPYRPRGGTAVSSRATVAKKGTIAPCPRDTSTFRVLADKSGPVAWPYDVKGLAGGIARILYFYSVLDVKAAGAFEVRCTTRRITDYRVLIADEEAADGDVVRLQPGRHPVLVALEPGDNRRADKIVYSFALARLTDEEAAARLSARQAEYEEDLACWTFWSELAAGNGRANPLAAYWLGMARLVAGNYLRWTIGDFGFNMEGEAYTQHSLRALLPFAHSFRNATGRPLVGGPNVGIILPGYTARTIFRDDGASFLGYSTGGAPLGVDKYARGFALVPDPLKPAVLWAWNRTQALSDAGRLKGPYKPVDFLDPMSAAFMFVSFPTDMKERDPAECLPRVPVDGQRGGYVFRNRWRDGDDICATMYLNLNFPGGSWHGQDSGDFRISGLGVDWAVRGKGCGCVGSGGDNTEGDFNKPFLGMPVASWDAPPTFFRAGRDGSGVLSVNMDRVYLGTTPGPKSRGTVAMQPAMCRGKPVAHDWGVRGTRSFAADYSGASGAPGLFVVADRIAGSPNPPEWRMVTDRSLTVTVEGNTFTIAAVNGASLRGTVVAPAAAAVKTRAVTHGHEATYDVHHVSATFDRTVIDVTGGDFFMVVMTMQRGEAPKVTVRGEGPSAEARVGGQSVRFDGEKVLLGAFAPAGGGTGF